MIAIPGWWLVFLGPHRIEPPPPRYLESSPKIGYPQSVCWKVAWALIIPFQKNSGTRIFTQQIIYTPWINIVPTSGWLEYYFQGWYHIIITQVIFTFCLSVFEKVCLFLLMEVQQHDVQNHRIQVARSTFRKVDHREDTKTTKTGIRQEGFSGDSTVYIYVYLSLTWLWILDQYLGKL